MAKLTEGIDRLAGVEKSYWDGANKKLTIYYNPDTTMERARIGVADYLARRQLQDSVEKTTFISVEKGESIKPASPKAKVRKPKVADIIMGEVILYGGLPMTRANVHRQALKDTGSAKAADMFAFGSHIKLAPEGTKPFTLAEFREVTRTPSTRRGSTRITPKRPRIS